jgi:hypothetical protein
LGKRKNDRLDNLCTTIFVNLKKPNQKRTQLMKSLLFTISLVVTCAFAFAQSTPASKVQQARTAQQIAAMSENELAMLEFRAEKLCWFEQLKNESQSEWYSLTDNNGNSVELTDAMVADFNPLLFILPQQTVRCENLPVQTTSGKQYLLIVRSVEMMQKEWERRIIKNTKTLAK